jgi:hypothetical protein
VTIRVPTPSQEPGHLAPNPPATSTDTPAANRTAYPMALAVALPWGDLVVSSSAAGVLADALRRLAQHEGRLLPELDQIRAAAGMAAVTRRRHRADTTPASCGRNRPLDGIPQPRPASGLPTDTAHLQVVGVARRWRVSQQYVRRLAGAGRIPGATKDAAGRWRFDPEQLRRNL